ncbi:hypothetical protein PHMEG_00014260 [Phytophthora megakarya]|uniref:Transmembrane protein n=1 Tax=Phytophthora megakarya TaxID=4795 RepID=A0A225W4Q0_9STRA|nr:hypothetical protein PHMEG_00014260 [Phytophthora megakarya]
MDEEGQKRLLDKYNSISGSLTVLLMKPLDVLLSMLVGVAVLCFATDYTIHHKQRSKYVVLGAIGIVGYLLNTGLSALNMQVSPGDIYPTILSSDLIVENANVDSQPLTADGMLTTTLDSKFRESTPGNSILNTIMRTLLVPTEEVPTWCNQTDDYSYPFKNVIASYGFPVRSWQLRALSSALEPTATLTIPMTAAISDLPSDKELPMNVSIATNLAVYALVVSNTFLGWWGSSDDVWSQYSGGYESVNKSVPLVMAEYLNLTAPSSATSTFVGNFYNVSVDYFNKAENASTTDNLAKLEFSHLDLSDTVVFDALTIDIPLQKRGIQEDNSSSSNPFYQSMFESLCNREACLMPELKECTADGSTTTIYPRVQALAICLNEEGSEDLTVDFSYFNQDEVMQSCKQRSNTSMIVVSVGKRIVGDAFEEDPTGANPIGRVVNARMVYSITIGRLSWEVENLASVYDATCASEGGCNGIRFPLEKAENATSADFLLVGDNGILMSLLSPINMNLWWFSGFSVGASQWKILASTVEETRGAALRTETRPALITLPRNFDRVNTSLTEYMNETGWENCEMPIDRHIHHVEKNHLYIEHSLQPAYTAGLYFIFQNGMVLEQLPSNASVYAAKTSLAFSGNFQDMHVQASIPLTNMLLTVAGCIIVLAGGIFIALSARRGEGFLFEHNSASVATEAIADHGKFPPFMLQVYLRDNSMANAEEPALSSLRVGNVVFVDKINETKQFVVGANGDTSTRL